MDGNRAPFSGLGLRGSVHERQQCHRGLMPAPTPPSSSLRPTPAPPSFARTVGPLPQSFPLASSGQGPVSMLDAFTIFHHQQAQQCPTPRPPGVGGQATAMGNWFPASSTPLNELFNQSSMVYQGQQLPHNIHNTVFHPLPTGGSSENPFTTLLHVPTHNLPVE